jgi:hypothetical protein
LTITGDGIISASPKNMVTADFSVEKMSGIVGGLGVIIGCNEGTSMISIVKDVP